MIMRMNKLMVAYCRALLCCSAVAIMLSVCCRATAQTVSISPTTGNVVSAASYSSESHIENYGGAWIHNQLPLTLLTSDEGTLTDQGLVKVHANNVGVEEGKLGLISGHATFKNHMTLSLPKGYRFTSYKIVLNYETWHSTNDAVATTFRETASDFSTDKNKVSVEENAKKVVLTRTSLGDDDMGNILYFLQDHEFGHSTVSVESFTVTFECGDPFSETLAPGSATLANAVSCIALPFYTDRVDVGEISKQTVKEYTSYKYNYNNVKDLTADFLFYDQQGIVEGTAVAGTTGDQTIAAIAVADGQRFLGLKNGTYWLEVPTDALGQDGKTSIPVGYRIVGARVRYNNALSANASIQKGDNIYITDGNGNYMNSSLEFTSTPVEWTYDKDGKVYTGSGRSKTYLQHQMNVSLFGGTTYSLSTTSNKNNATAYDTDGNNLYYESYYVSFSDNKGSYSGTHAVVTKTDVQSSDPSAFTLKLYDKTGNDVADDVTTEATAASGELVADDLNNDAIKLEVTGLSDDALAYVCLEVQLEALNPYIDKMDISCTQPSGEKKLKKQYLADDFTIGTDGMVDFSVPTNFATTGLKFAFEGLHSKSADETYPGGSADENSRYHFVRSTYYDLINENLQEHREDAANHTYTDKVTVSVAGDVAFRSNNSDQFKAGTSGDETFYYEETRYSNAAYQTQGGTWNEMTVTAGDDAVTRYIVVCDETRYNIAPTTTPRHAFYAYYSTDLKLSTVDYTPVLTYTKVYNNAVIPSGVDDNYYVGVSVSLKDDAGQTMDEGVGYVYAKQVVDQINTDIEAKKENAPVDAKHILYFDASKINSMLFSDTDAAWGKLEDLKNVLGQNALIFLPVGVTDNHDNVASMSAAGDDFVAENDIVLTDQWPFFSPYDIRVNAANEVSYARKVTNKNKTKKWVSLMLPFTIAVDPETGTYANEADKTQFTFYQMNADNAFSRPEGGNLTFDIDGHFSAYTGQTVTQANAAYVVRIDEAEASDDDPTLMFTVRQSGATIVKTPVTADEPLVNCGSSTGTVDNETMTLTNMATYAGASLPIESGVFYFNQDKFVSSLNFEDGSIYILPFRSYYTCESAAPAARSVRFIHISTEPNSNPNGISSPDAKTTDSGLAFSSQDGRLTVTTDKDQRVSIRNISGQTVDVATLRAGESRSVALPSGIYVVNGVKAVVK